MKLAASLLFLLVASAASTALRSSVKSKLSNKLRSSMLLKQKIAARKSLFQAREALSEFDPVCRESEGCTCDGDTIYSSNENCVLINKKIVAKAPAFADGDCKYTRELTEMDCGACEGQENGDDTSCYELKNYPGDTYFQYDLTYSSKTSWGKAKCKESMSRSDCTGPTPPPTPAPGQFTSYTGRWAILATSSNNPTVSVYTTWSETNEQEQSATFEEGWEQEVSIEFSYEAGAASSTVGASQSQSTRMEDTTTLTLSTTTERTIGLECPAACEGTQITYYYKVEGADVGNNAFEMSVPGNCLFECIDAGNSAPVCPPTYCDATPGRCDCCNSLEWADDPCSTDLPPLCPADPTTHRTAGPTKTIVAGRLAPITSLLQVSETDCPADDACSAIQQCAENSKCGCGSGYCCSTWGEFESECSSLGTRQARVDRAKELVTSECSCSNFCANN